ncbi:MAG: anti-sigma factor antagonist [Candidatus Krumholzibacteriota bacterium]|nr:anti-sigma factor antagonist [Candidatus Krumholzibacteriota bacterium]
MKEDRLTGKEIFRLDIPAEENNLGEVRDFIADICARAGFSKRETNNTKLAMDEACTNIIKHAYKDRAGNIKIEVEAEPGSLEITVFDRGKAFEWSKIKDPDLERYVEIGKKGGLGVYLMNRLMDGLDYKSSENGNSLFMTKRSAHAVSPASQRLFHSVKPKWTSTLRFKFAMRATFGLLGLVIFLWTILFINQSREIEDQRAQAWVNMGSFAKTLESKSENAMVIDDLFHPEYREINDFIQDRIISIPSVQYVRIVNNDGIVVASSSLEEFQEKFDLTPDMEGLPVEGRWMRSESAGSEDVEEFYYPVTIHETENDKIVKLGFVIMGVSRAIINSEIYDPRPRTTMVLFGIFAIGLALIYLLISVLVKPIQALTDGVRAIGEGAMNEGIHIDGPDEIGAIAEAFNEITAKFREAQESVVEQERMQKEMQVAQEIQHSLLPGKVPEIKGYDIASLYRAAKEVGGDYYDFVKVGEDSLGVVVADVSGKGVPGSLVMTMIRTALRMEARGNYSAAEVMSRMNAFVTEDMKKGMFVTIFYVILDSKNRIISYASAGHNPMILFRAETDETFFLNPRGFPVGISLPDDTLFRRSIDVEKIKLKKDDMLVIYTDGVTEAMNENREQYGEDRLIRLIKSNGRSSPDDFIERLNEDIRVFTGEYPQNDDITVVAVKEKMMADDVLMGIRKQLLDLVDIEGLTVAEACSRMKVSPSTYYRYRKRLAELGERGLQNKTLRKEHEINRVSIEQRKEMLDIVRNNPNFGAKRIADEFNIGKPQKIWLNSSLVYDELKRMRLNTYEKRLEYLRRNRVISEEEYQERLASPAARAGQARKSYDEAAVVETFEPVEPGGDAEPATFEEVSPLGDEETTVSMMAGTPKDRSGKDLSVSESGNKDRVDVERILTDNIPESEEDAVVSISAEAAGDDIAVIRVTGHLDSSSATDLENILESIYEEGVTKIIVNLEKVSYISSGGWGIFTGRVKTLREGKGDVVLTSMSPEVFDIYELLGFQDIIMHFQTVGEAVGFISLPFEKRQKDLEEITNRRKEEMTLEERVTVSSGGGSSELESSPWTPLAIEAGTVGQNGEITVLNLAGVIDTVSCMRLRDVLEELLKKGPAKFVIDMSKVEYVSSAGWGVFASRIDEMRSRGGDIKIFGMDPEVDSIFHLLGFDVIIRSFSIFSEAIDDFSEDEKSSSIESAASSAGNAHEQPAENGTGKDRSVLLADLTLNVSRLVADEARSVILTINGAVDAATTELFERYLEESLLDDPLYMVIDMSGLIYMSSAGWGTIIKYMQKLGSGSGKLVLSGMSSTIFKIFQDLGFEPLIPYYMTSEQALESLSAPSVLEHQKNLLTNGAGESDKGDPLQRESIKDAGSENETEGSSEGYSRQDAVEQAVPRVGRTQLEPILPKIEDDLPEIEPVLDLGRVEGEKETDDKKIRDLGWSVYGERLKKHNRKKSKKADK